MCLIIDTNLVHNTIIDKYIKIQFHSKLAKNETHLKLHNINESDNARK